MSRPTHRDRGYLESSYQNYGPSGVIDFAPPLACGYGEPSIYAQAGFPGYQQPLGQQYPQYVSPQYAPQYAPLAQGYPTTFPMAAPPVACQEEPASTAELHERINAKIDSIISSQRASAHEQKAEILGSQIDRLTRKVQKLSSAIESKRGDGFCQALAAEARAESDDEERVESRMRDTDIAARLRRLAAETKVRERRGEDRRSVPDW